MDQRMLEELRQIVGVENLWRAEPMSRHTTFRVGGPADVLIAPRAEHLAKIIQLCREREEPFYIIGNGSNLLVGDGGIRGVVLDMTRHVDELVIKGKKITVGAGTLLSRIANLAAENRLTGMEFAAGIPGTVGGAVTMNAGAYGGEMKNIVDHVMVLDRDGNEKKVSVDDLQLGYRTSCIPKEEYLVTMVTLMLRFGNAEEVRERMGDLRRQRAEKQPLEYASAGSTFKRPEGQFAGKLIMDAGLAGYQIGDAAVSEKHCGFIINRGTATAADIRALIEHVQAEVERQFSVVLEPEVKMLGEF